MAIPAQAERYQGEFKDDERHGRGTCIFPDGGRYTGDWEAGSAHGEGRFDHANGDIFVGIFRKRCRVRGKLTWAATGDEYDGEFANDLPHGQGSRRYASSGVVHSGRWERGVPAGEGERRDERSGVVRRGEFRGDELHGEGEEVLPSGKDGVASVDVVDRCTGHFEHGVRQGHGRLETADGVVWEGDWQGGVPHGQCTSLREPSDGGTHEYVGGWAHGARHGQGRQVDASGDAYEGAWVRGRKEGRGTETLGGGPEGGGEAYTGEFLDSLRHGEGSLTRAEGWRLAGRFQAGVQRGLPRQRL
jgi:hypothetical protein